MRKFTSERHRATGRHLPTMMPQALTSPISFFSATPPPPSFSAPGVAASPLEPDALPRCLGPSVMVVRCGLLFGFPPGSVCRCFDTETLDSKQAFGPTARLGLVNNSLSDQTTAARRTALTCRDARSASVAHVRSDAIRLSGGEEVY